MELMQLKYFVTVVEFMNFSKAAEKLHISQPSLSNAIKRLEGELDFQILERSTRNMRLTEGGEILYDRALHLLNEAEIIKKEMMEVSDGRSGNLYVGMIESAKHWMPKMIFQYNKIFPNMNLHLMEVLSEQDVKKSLRNYETHAIITNQLVKEDDIEVASLYKERFVLLLNKNHTLAKQQKVTLYDLVEEPLIITSESFQTRTDILKAFEIAGIEPTIKYEIDRFETALSFVSESLGVALIPENYIHDPKSYNIVSKVIESNHLERTVYLAYMKNRYMSPAVHGFIQKVKMFFN